MAKKKKETKADDEIRIPTIDEVRGYFQPGGYFDTWDFTELQVIMRDIVKTEMRMEELRKKYEKATGGVIETINAYSCAGDNAVGDVLDEEPCIVDCDEKLRQLSDQVYAEYITDAILDNVHDSEYVANFIFKALAERLMGENK